MKFLFNIKILNINSKEGFMVQSIHASREAFLIRKKLEPMDELLRLPRDLFWSVIVFIDFHRFFTLDRWRFFCLKLDTEESDRVLEAVQELHSRRFNFLRPVKFSEHPIRLLIQHQYLAAIQQLSIDDKDFVAEFLCEHGKDILFQAANIGDEKTISVLHACNVDVCHELFDNRRSIATIAALKGHEAVIQQLFLLGADLNELDDVGEKPLAIAMQCGHSRILAILHQFYQQRAREGSVPAKFILYNLCQKGIGCEKNLPQACMWLERSALDGCAQAQYDLGMIYYEQRAFQTAKQWFRKSAEQKNKQAEAFMGVVIEEGHCDKPNLSIARIWYERSAKQNCAEGMFRLALLYRHGKGCSKRVDKAFDLFEKAARLGHAGAQNDLGALYAKGLGCKKNQKTAFYWFQKSADQEDPYGQYNAGTYYEAGLCTNHDLQKAISYYKKSAEQGYEEAQIRLTEVYDFRFAGKFSEKEANYWFLHLSPNRRREVCLQRTGCTVM